MVKNRIPVCHVAVYLRYAACLTTYNMKATKEKINRIIGLDMHPDVFTAAALEKTTADLSKILWVQDRLPTASLESRANKHLKTGDLLVLEASSNSFEVAGRFHKLGYTCLVLESAQAAKIKENFCNDDRHSAVKLARVYLSGLAKIVWQPDEQTREMRAVFFTHRAAVKDCTRLRNRIRTFLNEYCVRLPKGTPLTQQKGLDKALSMRDWNPLQTRLITDSFKQLWHSEARRKQMEELMIEQLLERPEWARLWRLMGVRHIVAFAQMAMIGDVHRFPTAKKLVGYFGLSPRKVQSGNNAKGYERGMGNTGRGDVRALLTQAAQNALSQRNSPLHKWGWKLTMKKERTIAVAAVARKLTVAIWHLLKGHFTALVELDKHLETKLLKIATVLGTENLRASGFRSRNEFTQHYFKKIQLST
jgi:transposase